MDCNQNFRLYKLNVLGVIIKHFIRIFSGLDKKSQPMPEDGGGDGNGNGVYDKITKSIDTVYKFQKLCNGLILFCSVTVCVQCCVLTW